MRWRRINKDSDYQPANGTYKDWKPELAVEAENRCVYCAIHENSMGGIRNFHVEHYRPKSRFQELINDYRNLYYSCPICNTFKSNDWPREPVNDFSVACYPDPSQTDYNGLYDISRTTGVIAGKNVAALYVQEKIFLNRPQLITERKLQYFLAAAKEEINTIRDMIDKVPKGPELITIHEQFSILLIWLNDLRDKLENIPRYALVDVKRDV